MPFIEFFVHVVVRYFYTFSLLSIPLIKNCTILTHSMLYSLMETELGCMGATCPPRCRHSMNDQARRQHMIPAVSQPNAYAAEFN